MSIKDELLKYFSQFQDSTGGYGINPQPQGQPNSQNPLSPPDQTASNYGKLNPQINPMGTGGINQLDTIQNAMFNPIDASKAFQPLAQNPTKTEGISDMGKQLIAKGMSSLGGGKQMAQPALKIINAQQAFAQMPDATQPQQVQEFKPEQMAMMLRRKHGGL